MISNIYWISISFFFDIIYINIFLKNFHKKIDHKRGLYDDDLINMTLAKKECLIFFINFQRLAKNIFVKAFFYNFRKIDYAI